MKRLFRYNGLSIVLFTAFVLCWSLQALAGWRSFCQELAQHGQTPVTFASYLRSGHFIEATAENWESEFLQMAAFVWLTSFLFQQGSPESRSPDEPPEHDPVRPDSPWPARRGGWVLRVYENSLSLALVAMFVISFGLHIGGGSVHNNQERALAGELPQGWWEFAAGSDFWFQSMQNWQSEFLSIGCMVVLAIFLRQRGSPESKAVESAHHENE